MDPRQQFINDTNHTVGYNCFKPGTNEAWADVLYPGETCWLTEDEQRMTANAPRNPANNPFLTGALKPVTGERPIPSDNERPIAGIVGGAVQRPPAPRVDDDKAEDPPSPEVPDGIFEDTEEDQAARRRLEAEREAFRQGQIGAVPAQQVVETGSLGGDMGGDDGSDPELDGLPTQEESEANLGGEGDSTSTEETAEEETAVDHREETGAAVDPAGDPPEGEYAEHEEVGDPEAPASEEAGTPFRNGQGSADSGTRNSSKKRNRRRR